MNVHPTEATLRRLRAGEDSRNEFERMELRRDRITDPSGDNLAAEFVAFANAEGGMFFLGVDDAGTPIGIRADKLDDVEQWVVNIATDLCNPPIRPILRRAVVRAEGGDAIILLAEIKRGLSYIGQPAAGTFCWSARPGGIRTPTELARLFQRPGPRTRVRRTARLQRRRR